jgi:hypothetical protein
MGPLEAEGTVAQMLHSGAALDAIEDRIDEIPDLDSQSRAALWLYAWSRRGGEARTVLWHYAQPRLGRR